MLIESKEFHYCVVYYHAGRFAPAYFDLIYALTPSYYKNKAACKIVHKFSMDIIKQRRAELVVCIKLLIIIIIINNNIDIIIILQNGKVTFGSKRRYSDFIDIILQAKVSNSCVY